MTQKGTALSGKKILTVLTAAALALVTSGAAVAAPAASGVSSAFALSAVGALAVEPQAALDSRNGFRQTSASSTRLPDATAPVLSTGVLNSEADKGRARASVADLVAQLGLLKLPGGVSAVTAEAVSASCVDGEGSVVLAGAKAGAVPLQVQPPANTGITVPGVASVVLNKQTRAADGTLTVVGIAVEVAGLQKIDIASATCAKVVGRAEPTTTAPAGPTGPAGAVTTGPASSAASAPGKAPRPTAVEGHLAVTG
ncbi:choice-of-anchor P family protein [Actinosynnema sp. NPDC047251]|uniref:Putative secreted protein n=1 Tax=Saccharothrix espanaensis (strain ATCC 51144 / DSM 44229 / JCM 9112 / NBRC 15066 / NRRL 15764) TaxID=1179773 RepID=K0KCB9_SACES|nr:choice-of-anchor P family protein [Saccharothrix espanaensis]CCH35167.1 putative secreted protein [Saccharothrix espanaensis DSM 44229]